MDVKWSCILILLLVLMCRSLQSHAIPIFADSDILCLDLTYAGLYDKEFSFIPGLALDYRHIYGFVWGYGYGACVEQRWVFSDRHRGEGQFHFIAKACFPLWVLWYGYGFTISRQGQYVHVIEIEGLYPLTSSIIKLFRTKEVNIMDSLNLRLNFTKPVLFEFTLEIKIPVYS